MENCTCEITACNELKGAKNDNKDNAFYNGVRVSNNLDL
jgi:hypothetical protein